ncbi:MAG TPA: nuclear transport factor 2 family protein [Erythrobacter sp.]
MAASEAEIEALALSAMRAWVAADEKAMKKLTKRDFMCMVGTRPPQLLDRPSFLAAMAEGFACRSFTFREVLVRAHGNSAWFVAAAELKLGLGREAWEGQFLVSDLWKKGRWGGKHKLAERSIAVLDPDETRAGAIARLQLWHKGGKRR